MLKYFKEADFACPCCGVNETPEWFMQDIDTARGIAKIPFILTSAYRCEKHNKAINGKRHSSHLAGIAVDIFVEDSETRWKILVALKKMGFKRIGIGIDFIHADKDELKIKEVIWVY